MELLILLLFLFLMTALILTIVTYIFMGLSVYSAARLEGLNNKWFAWVPFLNMVLLFKLGNKDWKYIWLIVGQVVVSVIQEYTDSGLLLFIEIVLLILVVIVQIQAYLNISKKYEVNPAWFIVGAFFPPIMLVAYILFYNKVRKLETSQSIEQVKEIEEVK
ncbi:hypothetical protein QJR26_04420 [Clostridium baratii]